MLIVIVAIVLHAPIIFYLMQRQTKDVLPYRNRPYIPPPEPPNFASRTYRETDSKTGETYTMTEYVISTKMFTTEEQTDFLNPPKTRESEQ